jgi:NADH dehydrogenase
VTLVHAGPELLEQFAPSLRRAAHNRLTRSRVKVLVNTAVTAVTKAGLSVSGGEPIPAATIIWAAGVKAVIPRFEGMAPTLSGGRLAVGGSFQMLGSDRIFAAGDLAAYVDAHDFRADTNNVRPLPMLAQVAEAEAEVVAGNILAAIRGEKLKEFHYHSRGSMVSVGQWFAIGEILSMNIAGRLTWWLWRTVYLLKFASWRKRIRIAFDWAFEIISPRDITKL